MGDKGMSLGLREGLRGLQRGVLWDLRGAVYGLCRWGASRKYYGGGPFSRGRSVRVLGEGHLILGPTPHF